VSATPLRVLALTSIFPHAKNPRYAPYTRLQAAALAKRCSLDVLGLVPWFPGTRLTARWSHWGKDFSDVPRAETIDGVLVRHPRCFRIPRVGLTLSAATYAASLLPVVAPLRSRLDVLFATFVYPDGVAAILLGKLLSLPVVVQAIGSDVNVVARRPGPKAQVRLALPHAAGFVAVSDPLAEAAVALGARRDRVRVIPTGLDRNVFQPRDRAAARGRLGEGADDRIIVFVGRLVEDKGIRELLDAFAVLVAEDPRHRLIVVGEGPARSLCEARADLRERLLLTGELEPARIADWLTACDVLALPSYREGTPNVILEALGSGRRVVATRVGGIPAVVRRPEQGELVEPQDAPALAAALRRVLATPYDADAVSRSVSILSWEENADRVLALLTEAAQGAANNTALESGVGPA
jgi:teichuronic acid biosynthesis glycosyltransferase TuaC